MQLESLKLHSQGFYKSEYFMNLIEKEDVNNEMLFRSARSFFSHFYQTEDELIIQFREIKYGDMAYVHC